jgi:hypothetical protein
MMLRDRRVAEPIPLTPRELDVLDALREDRDHAGPGLDVPTVEVIAVTRWPEGVIRRLVDHGYQVGEMGGRYQLGHVEPGSTEAPAGGEPDHSRDASLSRTAGVRTGAGASVDPALPLFPADSYVRAAA